MFTDNLDSSEDTLSADNRLDKVKSFKEQYQGEMKLCVGYTVTSQAWDEIKSRMSPHSKDLPVELHVLSGVKIYIVDGQDTPMIGWYNKLAMELWIDNDGKWPSEKLPT